MMHTFVILAYKESEYLEDCINSVINQEYSSQVVIVTSTPNTFIESLAKKHKLKVVVNPSQGAGIGYDFDYALFAGKTTLVTIAHQDDIYNPQYAKKVVEMYEKNTSASLIFSDYYEIRDNEIVETNANLKIKRALLGLLKFHKWSGSRFIKRSGIALGNSICCPAVTFNMDMIKETSVFASHFKCNVDWYAWEKISKQPGKFIYINQNLMGHRVHDDSTTSEIIKDNIRTKEDYEMFQKFWPNWISKILTKVYRNSEKSNEA